jgi:hypothetical protein
MIAADIEDAVPTRSIIFESDLRAQLHELFFRKVLAQPRVETVGNIPARLESESHGFP